MLRIEILNGIAFVLGDDADVRRQISAESLQALIYQHMDKQQIFGDCTYSEGFEKFMSAYERLCLETNCHLMACRTPEGVLALGLVATSEITKQ